MGVWAAEVKPRDDGPHVVGGDAKGEVVEFYGVKFVEEALLRLRVWGGVMVGW